MNKAPLLRELTSLLMLAAAGTAVLISSARADTILVDTGTPNNTHYHDLNPYQTLAIQFSLAEAETITQINGYFEDYAFNYGLPPPFQNLLNDPVAGTINVDIVQDSPSPGGSMPAGASLYSGSFAISDTQTPAWLGVTGVNTVLAAGTYWVKFSTDDAYAEMMGNAPNHLLAEFMDDDVWRTNSIPAYLGLQIYGNPVPQVPTPSVPDAGSTALLFALGGASLLAFSSRRKLAA